MRTYDFRAVEARWTTAWERARCFEAPPRPGARKFFNYDSGPFPNGPLHMGHVRTYVLGDMTARYQRLMGRAVLYCTEWDSFGLPNEIAAAHAGLSPQDHVARWVEVMQGQLRQLGISYDWGKVRSTCAPSYVRVTQWLFLELLRAGLVEQREVDAAWCPGCATTLGGMQVLAGACGRCGSAVEVRRRPQWVVSLEASAPQLRAGLANLTAWSERARRALTGLVLRDTRSGRLHEWVVSRQRSWGTPIPVRTCGVCGAVPAAEAELPLGPADAAPAIETCARCGACALRERDTLDCFFDDTWCFLACLMDLELAPPASLAAAEAWMPVDHFHSGLDTLSYLPLHRFVGNFLHERGWLRDPEPIRRYDGNQMVMQGGRKMSKHLGNTVAPDEVLGTCGADALRVGMLWAAGPEQAIEWDPRMVEKAEAFLDRAHRICSLVARASAVADDPATSREPVRLATAAQRLAARSGRCLGRALQLVDEYRPHAALDELARVQRDLERFVGSRLERGRLAEADRTVAAGVAREFAQVLSPLAPFLAEELWRLLGEAPFVFQRRIGRAAAAAPSPKPQAAS